VRCCVRMDVLQKQCLLGDACLLDMSTPVVEEK
jgi:hypothetical protein